MKVYLIAGEPSGDLLGSRLMRALKKRPEIRLNFSGSAVIPWKPKV